MPLIKIYREQHYKELLTDPDCRSGYEYAKKHGWLWLGEGVVGLDVFAEAYLEIYHEDENRHSLGIAIYLQELATVKEKPR
jgi:hypothetical protein